MKKQVFTLILAALLLLTACQASDPDNLFGTTTPPDAVPETTVPMEVGVLGEAGNAYAYSNMQKDMPSGDFAYDGTQVVFKSNYGLYAYDLNTREVTDFCQDATCTHEKGKCPSQGVSGNLEWYDGTLYALKSGRVCRKQGETFETILEDGTVCCFFHADGDLFVHSNDNSLLRYPGGDGEKEVLIEEYRGYFATVFGDYLYYSQTDGFYRMSLTAEGAQPERMLPNVGGQTDGEHIYYNAVDTNDLYRCNMDGTESELLIADVVLSSRAAFDESYYYFLRYEVTPTFPHTPSGDSSIYLCRFPKDDPSAEERLATIPYSDGWVYIVPGYDRLFVSGYDYATNPNNPARYLYTVNTDGTDLREHPLPEH